jgi:deoxyribodipyrimidine photolyase-related protein
MPEYAGLNFFGHERKLPAWYWTGETRMRCLQQAVSQSLEKAYAYHIQRLMVTGSFGLMAGIHPDEMDRWYLGIYMDAIEWVEITNTRGMSQFADGGIVGTKPYCGSANYINKMSNYCSRCSYDKNKRHGENACPLNSLYWDFYIRNRAKLEKNSRIGMMYVLLDKMDSSEREAIMRQAQEYLDRLDDL